MISGPSKSTKMNKRKSETQVDEHLWMNWEQIRTERANTKFIANDDGSGDVATRAKRPFAIALDQDGPSEIVTQDDQIE